MPVDVVIVGAGIVGGAIAYELAKADLRVVVVERGEVGREASWAAGGILTPIHLADYPAPLAELCDRAQQEYPAIIEELRLLSTEDPEYRVTGAFVLVRDAEDETAAAKLEAWKRSHGRPCERRPEGLFLPDIAQIRNPRMTRALCEAAARRGVEFRTNTAVTGFLRIPGRVNGVRTDRGDVQAATTILAAGAWSGDEAARLGLALPVRPVKGQMLLLRAAPGSLPHILLHKDRYLIPRADGQILVGSTMEEAGFDKTVTAGAAGALLEWAVSILPALQEAPLVGSWAGLRPATPDRMPRIGPAPGYEGLIVATGHFRNGILLGPITGMLVRDLLLGRPDPCLAPFRPA